MRPNKNPLLNGKSSLFLPANIIGLTIKIMFVNEFTKTTHTTLHALDLIIAKNNNVAVDMFTGNCIKIFK